MSDVLKFTIPGKPEYVQMVRLAIASIAGKANFNVDAVEDIKEAVGEGCKVVFCHGGEGFCDAYEIICEITEENMTINLSDACGERSLVKGEMPCQKCPHEGDLAIAVMASLMDDVNIIVDENGKKHIKMVKNI
jgi:serine/threonine-protein kinase RsbW